MAKTTALPHHTKDQLYSKLPHADSVRLLTINPADSQEDPATLHCSLTRARLSESPRYRALSYAWRVDSSNPAPDQVLPTIQCNDQPVPVLPNLYHALFQLREAYDQNDYFWIDFLCINQDDLREKSTLTCIMAQIFQSAKQVVVWLGAGSPDLGLAVDLIGTLAALSPEQRAAYAYGEPALLPIQQESNTLTPVDTMEKILYSRPHWYALASFFQRSWFSRCWVAQEVLLARNLLIFCGSFRLSWETLHKVSDYLVRNAQNLELMRETFFPPPTLSIHATEGARANPDGDDDDDEMAESRTTRHDMPTRLEASRRILLETTATTSSAQVAANSFLKHLIRSRPLHCLDPRDTIYSLLGVVPSSPMLLPTPNYLLDPPNVYHQTAISILGSSSDLLLLAHAEGKAFRRYDSLPSWVPDWSVRESVGLGITGYVRFECGGESRERVAVLSGDKRVLTVEAAVFDTVRQVGEVKREVLRTGRFEGWLGIVRTLKEKFGWDAESILDVVWRSLITDTSWSWEVDGKDHPARGQYRECFLAWLEEKILGGNDANALDQENWIEAVQERWKERDTLEKGVRREESIKRAGQRLSPRAARYDTVYRFALQLKLFLTNTGLLSLGTESVEEGDVIAVVSGSRVPLILRPHGEHRSTHAYTLVGATYVHGHMHGEACKTNHLDFQLIDIY